MADGAKKKKRIMSSEELSSFCDQIALMLSSGMTLRDGIEMLAEDEQKGNDKVHPYTNLYRVVDETGSLYVAMKENEDEWPSYMIEMVDIGEQTGRLEDIMNSLSTYYQREGRIRSAAVSAITYPLVLGAMLVVIIGILLWRVLPIFRRVLASLGVDSSSSGSVLMKVGTWAGWIPEESLPAGPQADGEAFRLPRRRHSRPDAAERFPDGERPPDGSRRPGGPGIHQQGQLHP